MSQQALDLRGSIQILRRHKKIFGAITLLGLLIGVAYALITPPMVSGSGARGRPGNGGPGNAGRDVGFEHRHRDGGGCRDQHRGTSGRAAEHQPGAVADHAEGQDLGIESGRQHPVVQRRGEDRGAGGEHRERGRQCLCGLRWFAVQSGWPRGGEGSASWPAPPRQARCPSRSPRTARSARPWARSSHSSSRS